MPRNDKGIYSAMRKRRAKPIGRAYKSRRARPGKPKRPTVKKMSRKGGRIGGKKISLSPARKRGRIGGFARARR